mgnify:CR=1 FL=1
MTHFQSTLHRADAYGLCSHLDLGCGVDVARDIKKVSVSKHGVVQKVSASKCLGDLFSEVHNTEAFMCTIKKAENIIL